MPDNVLNPGDHGDRSTHSSPTNDAPLHKSQNDDDAETPLKGSGESTASAKVLQGPGTTTDVSWEEVEAVLSDPSESPELSPKPSPESSPELSPKPSPELSPKPSPELSPKPSPELSPELSSQSTSGTTDGTTDGTTSGVTSSMPSGGLPYDRPGSLSNRSASTYAVSPPLALVETAFLASTASLLWLISYYLSIGPWMRILFPIPIALVHLRWGNRAAWMAAIVSGLLLSVLMGPYLSILFLVPYGILGVQLGFLWQRKSGWGISILIGTIVATISLFFRLWLLSTFLGEDLWIYLTGRITDMLEWAAGILVNWGILGVGMLGQPDLQLVQLATVGMVLFSDLIYLFTVHLAAWLLLERVGTPISTPPKWVQVLMDEAR